MESSVSVLRPGDGVRSAIRRKRMNRGRRFAAVMLTVVFVPTTTAITRSDWPPELHAALRTYRMGDYEEAQSLCAALMSGTRDEHLRREAAALHAVATMRMPARDDWLDGRARLAQLAREDPTLLARPECRLAYGIAQLALDETASAIHELDAAATGFAERQQHERSAEACAALAQAWSRHNEWEVSLEPLGVQRPRSPDEARAIRRAEIAKLRERVATLLPEDAEAGARIDLVLAENLIDAGDKVAEGLGILERLASSAPLTAAGVQACLVLGQRYEQQGDWAAALRLYRQAQAAGLGEPSRSAEQRVKAISRPQLLVDVPASTPAGRPIQVGLRVRNLDSVQFELRRVDLGDWLTSRQGRFAEGRLPVAGSVVLTREIETGAATPYEWWTSAALPEPLTCAAEPGAYVAVARAVDADGRPLVSKELVLLSDLHAVTVVGQRHALIWATASEGAKAVLRNDLSARFWMHGSFVPTRPSFAGGVARLALPAEARLLRNKRWVCLVQAGEHLALCRGRLPTSLDAEAPAVALLANAPDLRPGRVLRLFGLLLPARGGAGSPQAEQALRIDVLNPVGRLRHGGMAEVSPTGVFSAEVPIGEESAGEHLNVIVRRGSQVLENVRGRFGLDVRPADAPQFTVTCRLPARLEPDASDVEGEVRALYPWGTPLAEAEVHYTARAMQLPSPDTEAEPLTSLPVSGHGRLDAQGRWAFSIPVALFRMPPGPLAVGVWARVVGWDQRQATSFAETFMSADLPSPPVYAWLGHDPPEPKVGEPVRFRLGWFDPESRASGQRPTLELRHADRTIARPRLYPTIGGLESEPWRANVPGTYEMVATLPIELGEPLQVRKSLEVGGSGTATGVVVSGVECQARYVRREQQWGLQVSLSGAVAQPLLVFAEAGDPLAASAISRLDGDAQLLLPIESERLADARVFVATVAAEGLQILTSAAVEPAKEEVLALKLEPAWDQVSPGTVVSVDVVCTRGTGVAPPAALFARLIDPAGTRSTEWTPAAAREGATSKIGGLTLTSSWSAGETVDDESLAPQSATPGDRLSPELAAALFEGTTLWADSRALEADRTRLDVPIPQQPGRYRLIVLAYSPSGGLATESLTLDAREGIRMLADVAEVFTIGDRSVLAVTVENPRSAPVAVGVSIQGGDGLHIETLHVADGEAGEHSTGEQASVTLTVGPRQRMRVLARVEAVRAGAGTAIVELDTQGVRQRLERAYRVLAAQRVQPVGSPDALPSPVRVKRTLLLLTGEREQHEGPADQRTPATGGSEERVATPLAPGVRLRPGQWLLIRDEITLAEPLKGVVWLQRMPAACVPPALGQTGFLSLGERGSVRMDSVAYSAAQLQAGKQIHECPLVVVRPGTYLLPPPEISVQGRPVAVEVEPAEAHIVVSDLPSSDALPQP
jgi:hypothetical protein